MSILRSFVLLSSALLLALAMLFAPARAQTGPTSNTIAYQGYLEDEGVPVADESQAITIGLFSLPSGGTAAYSETQTVTTDGGMFMLSIGGGSVVAGSLFDVNFSQPVWIEVNVGGTALSPRTVIQPAPVARTLRTGARIEGDAGTMLRAAHTGATGIGFGGAFTSESVAGTGVLGQVSAPSGTTSGVLGRSSSPDGRGVYGEAPRFGVFGSASSPSGFSYGVFGESPSTAGRGVLGKATATTGSAFGVVGQSDSDSGRGVWGLTTSLSGFTAGVYGEARSTFGQGLLGIATATTGETSGVRGETNSTNGNGIFGLATTTSGPARGVYGNSASTTGTGVYGVVSAESGNTSGVHGRSRSSSGRGVYAQATSASGPTYGILATVNSPTGYSGYFDGGRGLYVKTTDLDLQFSSLLNEDIVVENTDAVIGLYSNQGGTWGSAISLGALDAAGALFKKWTIASRAEGFGLSFIHGTQGDYSQNDVKMSLGENGALFIDGAYNSGGADFAEWFPLQDASVSLEPGQLVGITEGRAGLATENAEQVMIVSSNPAFVGNPDAADGGALIALVGQAEVRLANPAQVGDLLVASGMEDGAARPVSPVHYDPASDGPVAGRVLQLTTEGTAIALVGVDEAAALRAVVVRQQAMLDTERLATEHLRNEVASHEARLSRIEALLDQELAAALRSPR